MKARTLLIGLALGGALWAPASALAQLIGPRLTLDGYAGGVFWDKSSQPTLDNSLIFGGRAGIQVRDWFAFEATYAPTWTNSGPGVVPFFARTGGDTRVNHLGLDGRLDLLPAARFCPYITAGWTQLEFAPDQGETQTLNGWEAGAGLFMRLADRVRLRFDVRDLRINQDVGQQWVNDMVATGGVHFDLGGYLRDADGDGVADRKDRCPNTPRGATVDAAGCPHDTDGDGVFDGIDRCADTPRGARVDARGCPQDGDGDGVFDGLDQCANTPAGATVDARGCPQDSDGDGVYDGLDQCANTPTGCTVDAHGCPVDSDGDGICDGLDQCPSTPAGATVDNKGCPVVVSEKEVQFLDTGLLRLDAVRFASGKAEILPESDAVLDEVGKILADWPQLQVEIGGHTDSRGAAAFNETLSAARAQAVLDYLLQKYPKLTASQYSVKGYGEAQPVADNKTELGKAQNRRVEFKVLNREVLKKEVEKRGLLRKEGQ
jgi:outer membrane protein OmpA-like peptidoglycan-associated protein